MVIAQKLATHREELARFFLSPADPSYSHKSSFASPYKHHGETCIFQPKPRESVLYGCGSWVAPVSANPNRASYRERGITLYHAL